MQPVPPVGQGQASSACAGSDGARSARPAPSQAPGASGAPRDPAAAAERPAAASRAQQGWAPAAPEAKAPRPRSATAASRAQQGWAPPQLEQILTPQQQKAYNEEIDRNISRAQRTLAALGDRSLNSEQQTYLERIRAFLKQAENARKSDLFRARNLAERASLLAADLLRSVQ